MSTAVRVPDSPGLWLRACGAAASLHHVVPVDDGGPGLYVSGLPPAGTEVMVVAFSPLPAARHGVWWRKARSYERGYVVREVPGNVRLYVAVDTNERTYTVESWALNDNRPLAGRGSYAATVEGRMPRTASTRWDAVAAALHAAGLTPMFVAPVDLGGA